MYGWLFQQKCEQIGTCIFEQIEHKLKAFGTFIIRIGHGARRRERGGEIAHPRNLTQIVERRCMIMEVVDIRIIHSKDYVEVAVVGQLDCAAMVLKSVSAV